MNYAMLRFSIGRILLIEALLLIPSLLVSFIYREPMHMQMSFILPILILLAIGLACSFKRPKNTHYYTREGMIITAVSWFLLSLFGGLPFYFSGEIPSMIDCFFETVSGFTTTGASILTNVEALSHSTLFWRSFTHLIGGMGVLVFALAIMPRAEFDTVHMMKAEVPGPVFGKLLSRVTTTARILYIIYLVMTAILIVILIICGMPVFDSFLHAFGAAGTGGFAIKNTGVAYYHSPAIEYTLAIGMLLFGCNFNLYYLFLIKQFREAIRSEELRWYFGIFAGSVAIICIDLWPSYHGDFSTLIRDTIFTVSSIQTTTGYSTVDFDTWPVLSHVVLLFTMFVGGCAGSTAGGLKASRVGIYIKQALLHIKQSLNPNRQLVLRFEGRPLQDPLMSRTNQYLSLYIGTFVFILAAVSLHAPDFLSSFSAVAATFNNIGPGMGVVGPTANYFSLPDYVKLVLSFAMIAGRLEILPVLILFSRRTWRRH